MGKSFSSGYGKFTKRPVLGYLLGGRPTPTPSQNDPRAADVPLPDALERELEHDRIGKSACD